MDEDEKKMVREFVSVIIALCTGIDSNTQELVPKIREALENVSNGKIFHLELGMFAFFTLNKGELEVYCADSSFGLQARELFRLKVDLKKRLLLEVIYRRYEE